LTDPAVAVRRATEADFPPIEAIYVANEPPTPTDPPDPTGWMTRYLEHLVGRGEMHVAEAGSVVQGFVAVVDIGKATHLADLFVDPAWQGQGIGGLLLRTAMLDPLRHIVEPGVP
jgi:ribosomal protein S18 acetylase RimI-like enzyme